MKIKFLLSALIIGLCINAESQPSNIAVTRLIDSAKILFCNSDTIGTIKALEEFKENFPENAMVLLTNKTLSDLYIMRGQTALAIEKMKYAIYYRPTKYSNYNFNNNYCSKILTGFNYSRAKGDMCVSLSQLYFAQNQFDSSIYFLNLADCEYVAYQNCGNGINMYRSFLSTYFADYYLNRGDTANAINRLLDFFMNTDGDTKVLTKKLKSILLLNYTQTQITNEVTKGLKEIKFIKRKDDGFDILITLFGHTIKEYGYGQIKSYRQYYTKSRSVALLKSD